MAVIENSDKTMVESLKNSLDQTESIDILTAYFYFSGYNLIADELKDKKVRILVGMAIDPAKISRFNSAFKNNDDESFSPYSIEGYGSLSRSTKREKYMDGFVGLFNKSALSHEFDSQESRDVFDMFLSKIEDGTLEIKMTGVPDHAKVYVLTYKPEYSHNGDDKGVVFMGSSNFTYNGLLGQREINDRFPEDNKYDRYRKIFNERWEDAKNVDICTKSTKDTFVKEIRKRLSIYNFPDPYKIYIRVLHEMFSTANTDKIATPYSITGGRYSDYKYQMDAIVYGLDCLEKNNGVIVSDVVGLGKSIIVAAIAYNLNYRHTVIIAPPHLVDMWEDYQREFCLRGVEVFSSGKIDDAYEKYAETDEPILYIIDEAHRYRNEKTHSYVQLHRLTRSNFENKVILLTATPYNNKPQDLFALIKLFQTPSRSTLNTVDNLGIRIRELEIIYGKLEKRWKKDGETKEIKGELDKLSAQLRELIAPVIIRRSRIDLNEIDEYADDLRRQKVQLPEVVGPELIQYNLAGIRDLYIETLRQMSNNFSGARYNPSEYLIDKNEFKKQYGELFGILNLNIFIQAQRNIASFIKRLIVMRFESSREAFRVTVDRLIKTYQSIIKWWDKGYVPIKKQGYPDDPDDEDMKDLVKEIDEVGLNEENINDFVGKAIPVEKGYFKNEYLDALKKDLSLLEKIYSDWFGGEELSDPKYDEVSRKIIELQKENPQRKIVVFSTYADTAESISEKLCKDGFKCCVYTGASSQHKQDIIKKNFDASISRREQKNDYDILVATDALSEGFNLNRAGVVINYDIPYNPTRVVQRIGRINRINKKMFDKLYIYNFFPTDIGERNTLIKNISTLKMLLINNIVGNDTRTLTPDEDLQSYFKRAYDEADSENSERSWDVYYRNIYNSVKNDKDLIEEVMRIPERVKIVRKGKSNNKTVAYAKRGDTSIFVASNELGGTEIVAPEVGLRYFESMPDEKAYKPDSHLDDVFNAIRDELQKPYVLPKMEGNRTKAIDALKKLITFCPEEKDYLSDLIDVIKKYDDLCDGELKILADWCNDELDIIVAKNNGNNDGALEKKEAELWGEIKREFSEHYIEQIIAKAESVNSKYEIIMFTEGLRDEQA